MMKFNEKYNQENFLSFLRDFLPDDFQVYEKDIILEKEKFKKITKVRELGFCESLDLYILEIDHNSESDPRVAIATEAFKVLAQYWAHRALVIFKNKESENYRLSYLTISLDQNDKNKITKKYSNARRYSFYLGADAKTRTPKQQLIDKGRIKDVDDLLSRFSVEVVNKQFYLEVAKFFDELVSTEVHNLLLPSVSESDLNTRKSFAVRLIGRVMFCWFLKQKKSENGQLIPDELLSSNVVDDNYYHSILEPLFFSVLNTSIDSRDIRSELFDKVPYLNGGLFNPQPDDYYEMDRGTFTSKYINTLKINDKWFKDFFELLETYNFTIDENTAFDQELSVDPEMLGKIFENLLAKKINIETGVNQQKETGSFYTPRAIVEYMVDQSLIEYFKTKTQIDENKIYAVVSYDLNDDNEHPLSVDDKKDLIDAIESLKILDPACGSGAYPIGVLQKIVYVLQQIDPDCTLWLEKKLHSVPDLYKQKIINEVKQNPFDYTRKLDVIKNSIFGVDIQSVAVDVSRLRCFLTLVVESAIDDSKPNRGIEPLPNLDFKFVCANTLIPLPKLESVGLFDDHSGIVDLSKIMSEYFSCNSQRKNEIKLKFSNTQKEILEKTVSAFGRNTGELTLKLTTWNPFSNHSNSWFDPEWMFGLGDKFDIVIANPPYIDSETMVREQPELRELYNKIYSTAKGNWDLYIPFLELGHNLLKEKGIASYITPNKWYAIGYGKEIRTKLLYEITRIANCNLVKVFEAGNSPVVTFFKKNSKNTEIVVDKFDNNYNITESPFVRNDFITENFGVIFADNLKLILKIKSQTKLISSYFKAENPCSVSEAYEIINIIKELDENSCKSEDYLKFVNTGTIDPFVNLWGKKITTYLKSKYAKPIIMGIDLKNLLPRRFEQFKQPKLIISGMRHFESFLDENGNFVAGKSTEVLFKIGNLDIKIALGILNSSLIGFYIKQSYSVLGIDGGINFTPDLINNLPLPEFNEVNESQIISIVNNIISNNSEIESNRIKINELVMGLYGLNEKEKEIIRNS